MTHLIFREMRSERQERLFGRVSRRTVSRVSGHARNMDEAVEVGRELEHTRDGFQKPLAIEGGPERRQAFVDDILRIGKDPDEIDRQWHGQDGQEADCKRYRNPL